MPNSLAAVSVDLESSTPAYGSIHFVTNGHRGCFPTRFNSIVGLAQHNEVAMLRQCVMVKDQRNNVPELCDIACGIAAQYRE